MSSLSSSTRASFASSFESNASAESFFVLCVYDFEAADADQLSFRSNEILEIVKQEESGWWAAFRQGDDRVGWIPSAYVEPISESTVGEPHAYYRDRQRRWEGPEDDDDHHYDPNYPLEYSYSQSQPRKHYEWVPMLDSGGKPLPPTPLEASPRNDGKPLFSPGLTSSDTADSRSPGQELTFSSLHGQRSKEYPPSPSTPMPTPPPKSAPITTSGNRPFEVRRSLSCGQPPLPDQAASPLESDSSTQARLVRRRPVLIEDSFSLKRLSVLLETHGAEEADHASHSHSSDASDAMSLSARSHSSRSDKVRQITGEDSAQALYEANSLQVAQPAFLHPIHGDDEIHLDPSGMIVSGTLPAIVERLTLDPLNPAVGQKMRHIFLRTFRTFGSANEIFDLLQERYDLDAPQDLSATELEEWRTKRLLSSQKRVLSMFAAWLVEHNMIEDDPPIAQRLQQFLAKIHAPPENVALAQEVMKTLSHLTFTPTSAPVQSAKPHKRKKTKDSKNELLRTDPTVLAEQLCLHEHRYYAKIRFQECLDWIKSRESRKVGNLFAFCALHDKLAAWVKQSVLWTDALGRRADTVDFWIKVAEKCRAMHNYSSMSAIVTGLSSTVVSKLHLTWAHVGRTSHLDPLSRFNDPSGSFSAFRQAQQVLTRDVPCVPFVGMYLTDLMHINDQYADKPEGHLSFMKRRKWTEVMDTMLQFQKVPYTFAQDPAVTQFLEGSLAIAAEKDPAEFWSRSQEVLQVEVASADIRKGLQAAGF